MTVRRRLSGLVIVVLAISGLAFGESIETTTTTHIKSDAEIFARSVTFSSKDLATGLVSESITSVVGADSIDVMMSTTQKGWRNGTYVEGTVVSDLSLALNPWNKTTVFQAHVPDVWGNLQDSQIGIFVFGDYFNESEVDSIMADLLPDLLNGTIHDIGKPRLDVTYEENSFKIPGPPVTVHTGGRERAVNDRVRCEWTKDVTSSKDTTIIYKYKIPIIVIEWGDIG